ncbi:hypothetical protein JQM64_05225 [Fournierella massiliensis]|nr:hypothetical protein [Fournierella massiliensis]MCF2556923.1 hypothetical protein [Fournierella massiliensis]
MPAEQKGPQAHDQLHHTQNAQPAQLLRTAHRPKQAKSARRQAQDPQQPPGKFPQGHIARQKSDRPHQKQKEAFSQRQGGGQQQKKAQQPVHQAAGHPEKAQDLPILPGGFLFAVPHQSVINSPKAGISSLEILVGIRLQGPGHLGQQSRVRRRDQKSEFAGHGLTS